MPRSKQFSCRRQAKALLRSAKAEFQRQGHGAAPGLARVGCAQPGRHQHPAIHVGPGLRGVGQRAQIGHAPPGVAGKPVSVEVPHEVVSVGADEHPAVHTAFIFQLEQVRALPGLFQFKGLRLLPCFEVMRTEDAKGVALQKQHHDVSVCLRMVKHLGVPCFRVDEGYTDHVGFFKQAPSRPRKGQPLCGLRFFRLSLLAAHRGIEKQLCPCTAARGVFSIHKAATREYHPVYIGVHGFVQLLPAQQVPAHGVAPVHVAPLCTKGVVLEIQVVPLAVKKKAVGVVHPPSVRGEVNGRVVFLFFGNSFMLLKPRQPPCGHATVKCQCLSSIGPHVPPRVKIRWPIGRFNIQFIYGLTRQHHGKPAHFVARAHGQPQVIVFDFDLRHWSHTYLMGGLFLCRPPPCTNSRSPCIRTRRGYRPMCLLCIFRYKLQARFGRGCCPRCGSGQPRSSRFR